MFPFLQTISCRFALQMQSESLSGWRKSFLPNKASVFLAKLQRDWLWKRSSVKDIREKSVAKKEKQNTLVRGKH